MIRILNGDCRDVLRTLPDASVNCVVTSPPYFGLRDYGHAGQIGLEPTPAEFVAEIVGVFREVRRVLRDDGTLWLNLGDSYNAYNGGAGPSSSLSRGAQTEQRPQLASGYGLKFKGLKPKDLIGIPWCVAFALQSDGWYLRQDIIWSKPNPMPESVRDRCTKAHEYIFMLSKSARYFYDAEAIKEPMSMSSVERLSQDVEAQHGSDRVPGKTNGTMKAVGKIDKQRGHSRRRHAGFNDRWDAMDRAEQCSGTRNKRSVWEIATQPFSEAHFATFPPALIEPCIKAGCPDKCCVKCMAPWVRDVEVSEPIGRRDSGGEAGGVDMGMSKGRAGSRSSRTLGFVPSCSCECADTVPGTVLDPFGGAGTTGLVADRLQRNAILIELNPEYAAMARRRIDGDAPLFAGTEAA